MKSTSAFLLCSALLTSAALAQLKPVEPQPPAPAPKPSAAESAKQVQPGTQLKSRAPAPQASPPAAPAKCDPSVKKGEVSKTGLPAC